MSDIKLCKDCMHCKPKYENGFLFWRGPANYDEAICEYALKAQGKLNVVSGVFESQSYYALCNDHRSDSGLCKNAALFFEPKEAK